MTDGTLSERITVYQEGEEPQLTATASQQTFGPEGGTLKIEINSNVDYETLLPDASWITEDQARNQSTHTLYFTISPNETYDNRQADIVFKDKESELADTVRVMQLQKTHWYSRTRLFKYLAKKTDLKSDSAVTSISK